MITLWKRLFNYLKVKNAVNQAVRLHALTGKKYYVLSINHKLRVLDRTQVNYLCDSGILDRRLKTHYYTCQAALFYTGLSAPKPQTFQRRRNGV